MRWFGPICTLALVLGPSAALADSAIDVTIDQSQTSQLGLDAGALEGSLTGAIDDAFNLGNTQAFLGSMADASALASKGMGVDYASNFDKIVVGWSLGTGVSGGGATFGKGGQELPDYGFSFQMAGMAGVNLGLLSGGEGFLSRIAFFGHGMTLTTGSGSFDAELLNYGGHVQFHLVKARDGEAFAWGGLALTTGFEHSEYRLNMVQAMPVTAPSSGVEMTWDATGDYVMKAWSDSVPVELSTNLRVMVLTAFLGVGMDYNTGQATVAMDLGGDIEVDALGQSQVIGDATVSYIDNAQPGPTYPRIFGGAQFNLFMVKLYGQVNVGLDEGFGGHAGMRIAL